jgi:phage terminase large subunit
LQDALLVEIRKWGTMLPNPLQDLFVERSDRIELEASKEQSFFSARTSRAEKPEALQGIHCDPGYVLLIADEASGVPEQVFEAAVGSMSGHNCQTLLIGNPVRTSGLFYDTHNKLKDMWVTVQVSYTDSSRVAEDFVKDVARRYGEDSNAFRIRCLGEFPRADDDTLIPYYLVADARDRDIQVPVWLPTVWGVDVARFGDDRSALVERNHRKVMYADVWDNLDTMQTAARIRRLWDEREERKRPHKILIDVIGIGSGVVDRLRELGLPAIGVNVSMSATEPERFRNVRSELWWKAREWLMGAEVALPRAPKGSDPREEPFEILADELVAPKYRINSNGRLEVEPKDAMKKRGHKSPNVADAFIHTFAEDLSRLIHGSAGGASGWNEPILRNLPVV